MDKILCECHITGCRNLQTTCVSCGRIVCTSCLPKSMEWISVGDRLPENQQEILMTYNDFVMEGIYFKEKFYQIQTCEGDFCEDTKQEGITHWMPLPEPPMEKLD